MAITLAEAKVGMADKVDQQVVDEFRRSSLLLDRLVFDNAISPGTGGSTLTYGYIQLKTPSTAAVRAINSEYTAGEAKREEKTAKADESWYRRALAIAYDSKLPAEINSTSEALPIPIRRKGRFS